MTGSVLPGISEFVSRFCCRSQLEQLSSDVSASLDKLEGREQQLTGQFQGLLDTYRESRQQLNDMQEEFSR